jgi:CheY-like chemotaxis protein
MRVLVVEDHEAIASAIIEHLRNCQAGVPKIARDVQTAEELLEEGPYDVIVCDRKLPSQPESLDEAEELGDALIARIVERFPGTPIMVLTAYASLELARRYMQSPRTGDVFGSGPPHWLLNLYVKTDLSECLRELERINAEVSELDSIEITPPNHGLRRTEARVVRIYTRRVGGAIARVQRIGGGLSNVVTLRVRVEDAQGATRASMFAKVGTLTALRLEDQRYQQYVPGLLGNSAFAPLGWRIECGAGDVGGLFYNLADGFERTLLDCVVSEPNRGEELVATLAAHMDGWQRAKTQKQSTVAEIRRSLLKDDVTAARLGTAVLGGDAWRALEGRKLVSSWCPQHCDLHGLNALADSDGRMLLIDYGDVRVAPSCLDFITLELSLLFHPNNILGRWGWPSAAAADQWNDVDSYTAECPVAPYVRACRTRATASAVGAREVLATAYAYALRQLKYDDTDKELAAAIVRACAREFEHT